MEKNLRMIGRVIRSWKQRGPLGFAFACVADFLALVGKGMIRIRDHWSPCRFIDRSRGRQRAVFILAGYKRYLWPATLERIKHYAIEDADYCIVSPGLHDSELERLCADWGWSYLSVMRNSPGVALNKAIALHPKADYIYKIDEDIFISKRFLEGLMDGYTKAWQVLGMEPGFCAPVLNVNGVSVGSFLDGVSHRDAYERLFGKLVLRCGGVPAHSDPEACWWLWTKSLPFDQVAEKFSSTDAGISVCATRFSIGAILFRREFILQIGGVRSSWRSGVLGVDEDGLCRDCVSHSRPMVIVHGVLAGHFSFYPQEERMRARFVELSQFDARTFPKFVPE